MQKNSFKISFDFIKLFLLLLGIRLLFDISYSTFVSTYFNYQNFNSNISFQSNLTSWILFIFFTPLIIKTMMKHSISNMVVSVLSLISLMPILVMIKYNSDYSLKYTLLITVYWAIFLIFNLLTKPLSIVNFRFRNQTVLKFLAYTLIIIIFYLSWKFTGLRLQFNIYDVYDIRAEARGYDVGSVFLSYLGTMADNILPVLFIYFVVSKNRILAFLTALSIFINYGIHSSKQVIFLLFIALSAVFFKKIISNKNIFLIGTYLSLFFSYIEFLITETYFIATFFIYRILFIPAKLHNVYFSFFDKNELDYFRQSFLKYFFESPYDINIGFLMGYEDVADITGRANNGLFSDAFMNLGVIGIIFFPLILVIILKFIDGANLNIDNRIKFVIVCYLSFVLLGLPFSTFLFSGGVLLTLMILYTMPKKLKYE